MSMVVGIFAETELRVRSIRATLPDTAHVVLLPRWPTSSPRDIDVLVVAWNDLRTFPGGPRDLGIASGRIPWILITQPEVESLRLLYRYSPQQVLVGEREESEVWRALREVHLESPRLRLLELCRSLDAAPPIVQKAWERVLAPPTSGASGRPVIVRRLGELAGDLGCSPAYLARRSQAQGVPIVPAIRWSLVLHGLRTYRQRRCTWTRVAHELGMPSSAAWSNAVRRLLGVGPTRALSLSPRVINEHMCRDLPALRGMSR